MWLLLSGRQSVPRVTLSPQLHGDSPSTTDLCNYGFMLYTLTTNLFDVAKNKVVRFIV